MEIDPGRSGIDQGQAGIDQGQPGIDQGQAGTDQGQAGTSGIIGKIPTSCGGTNRYTRLENLAWSHSVF